jgi:hypothetical protein
MVQAKLAAAVNSTTAKAFRTIVSLICFLFSEATWRPLNVVLRELRNIAKNRSGGICGNVGNPAFSGDSEISFGWNGLTLYVFGHVNFKRGGKYSRIILPDWTSG